MTQPAPHLPAAFLAAPIAHRGLHDGAAGRPENSRAAVAAAVAAGYGIEIDLQGAACGTPMVFHDDTLERMTGATGPLRARTGAQLATLRLAGSDQGIPTLAEVLALVAGRVALLVELKDQAGTPGGADGALERAVARDLRGYAGPVAVMSFSPDAMARIARAAPDLPRGLTTCAFADSDAPGLSEAARRDLRAIAAFEAVGASFVSHHWRDLARRRVQDLRAAGVPVLCWTIRSPVEAAAARSDGAANITFEGYLPPAGGAAAG